MNPDDMKMTPLFDPAPVETDPPQAVPVELLPDPPTKVQPPTAASLLAWTRDVLGTLPPDLQYLSYIQVRDAIVSKHLRGWVLTDQPLRREVPVPGNGTRERTFKQLVLLQTAKLPQLLEQCYAAARREAAQRSGGRTLTLDEALSMDARSLDACTPVRPPPGPERRQSRKRRSDPPAPDGQ